MPAHGIMLLFDEVKVGFGRTGKMFGFEHWGVTPDAVAMGKSMGGGMPAQRGGGRAEILDAGAAINMYTVAGNPVSCTAGLATSTTSSGTAWSRSRADRRLPPGRLQGAAAAAPADRGRARQGHDPGRGAGARPRHQRAGRREAAKLVYRCKELGLILFYGGIYSNVIEVTPPLTMTEAEVDEGVAILDQAIGEVEAGEVSDEVLGEYAGW